MSRSRRPPKKTDKNRCFCGYAYCWMSQTAIEYEAKEMNDKHIAKDYSEYVRQQLASGLDEHWAEAKEPCSEPGCSRSAEWFYPSHHAWQYCDDHVPRRGCSCNLDEDGVELLGEDGRRLPCVDWMHFELVA